MTEETIIVKLKEIMKLVVNRDADLEKITPDSKIATDLGVNSIGLVYLVIAIEETFGIDMSDVTFNTFVYVRDVIAYIAEKSARKGK